MGRQANLSGLVTNFDRGRSHVLSQVVERVGCICSVGRSVRTLQQLLTTSAGGDAGSNISPDTMLHSTLHCRAPRSTRSWITPSFGSREQIKGAHWPL